MDHNIPKLVTRLFIIIFIQTGDFGKLNLSYFCFEVVFKCNFFIAIM